MALLNAGRSPCLPQSKLPRAKPDPRRPDVCYPYQYRPRPRNAVALNVTQNRQFRPYKKVIETVQGYKIDASAPLRRAPDTNAFNETGRVTYPVGQQMPAFWPR